MNDPLLTAFGIRSDRLYIDGVWRPAMDRARLCLLDPSDGSALADIAAASAVDVDTAVDAAGRCFRSSWSRVTALERGRLLARLGNQVSANTDALAELEARDVGKPLRQARADAMALARYCEFYAGAADKLHGETLPYQAGYTVYTLREPHGVTGHIVPWNYPMQIIGRSVGAALAAGNAVVLKPAEDACLTALAFAELSRRAGFPPGVVNVLPGTGAEAGAALAAHPGVQHVSFTGSVATGREVQCAAAAHVAPVTLELGGKSAQLVFADADLDAALPYLLTAAVQNAGQTCSAASRLLVQRPVCDELMVHLEKRIRALVTGPALDDRDIGPLVSAAQLARVGQLLEQAGDLPLLAEGRWADRLPAGGFYTAARLYGPVPAAHVLAQEELFAPVLVLIPFDDEDEAVEIANGTPFGLVAAVWTRDGARQYRLARRIAAGQVFVNNYGAGGGVELPFGGVGNSGHGREKGFEALYAFTALKTVAVLHG